MNEVPLDSHQHVNPYIAGSPVTGTEMFYGREDVFSFIRRNLIGRHRDTPVVLYGQRRTGKTSVLYQLHRHLDPRYRCIFIDLHGLNLHGMGDLMLGIASSIRRGLQRDHGLAVEVPDRAAFLTDSQSTFEGLFLDRVWTVLGEDHLVLMMDEVIRLDEEVRAGRLERDIFDYLRHLMQHYSRLNFIFSLGSGLEEMAKDYAFLFSVSLYHRISFLEPAAASELITQPARDHYEMEPQAVARILQITSGHPYYTQLVCHCIFDLWSRSPKPTMSAADVDAVMAEAIELGSANLTYVWEDSSPGEQTLLAGMAAVMRRGSGPVTVDQVRDAWREVAVPLPEHEVARALQSLTSREVIAGTQAYSFTVDLQRMWLEKHRRLDWVKDQLAATVRQWDRSAEPRPVDSIPSYVGGPEPSSAPGVPHDGEGRITARAKRRIARRVRYLAITAAVIVVLASYLATAKSARVFPFPNNPPAHSVNNPPSHSVSQGLVQLLPGELGQHEQECHPIPPPNLWNMPGLVQELHCTDPGLKGGNVYAYQLDSALNFRTAWQNFNKWWKFPPGNAGKKCPPEGAAFGTISFSNSALPSSDNQVLECGLLALSPNDTVPVYVWAFPTNNAFEIAEGAAGSSFSTLISWLTRSATAIPSVPRITSVRTYTQGVLVYFDIHYTDPGHDAKGFGFVGVNGSGWAEENHLFSSPSYGIAALDSVSYPFNEGCGTAQEIDSYVEAWINDKAGGRTKPVVIHLVCA
jgi:AAA domain